MNFKSTQMLVEEGLKDLEHYEKSKEYRKEIDNELLLDNYWSEKYGFNITQCKQLEPAQVEFEQNSYERKISIYDKEYQDVIDIGKENFDNAYACFCMKPKVLDIKVQIDYATQAHKEFVKALEIAKRYQKKEKDDIIWKVRIVNMIVSIPFALFLMEDYDRAYSSILLSIAFIKKCKLCDEYWNKKQHIDKMNQLLTKISNIRMKNVKQNINV